MVIVDKETCIGCSACEAVCPGVFEMYDDLADGMKSRVKPGMEKEDDMEEVKESIEVCPVDAIS
jgi:ferredoxin